MNDETLDELLSAAIDGLATDEELALIAQTPGSDERLIQLRSAADSVSAPLPRVASEQRKKMIALAVDSFEPSAVAEPLIETEPAKRVNVVPIRPRWNGLRSGSAVAGGIAASIVAMGLLASVIGSAVNSADDDSAESTADGAIEMSAEMPAATDAPAATTAAAAEALVDEAGSADTLSGVEYDAPADTQAAATATTTTLESAATDQDSSDGVFTPGDRAITCWEAISKQFPDYQFDESAEELLEDGSLLIPTLDSAGNSQLISVDAQTCLFQLITERP